MSKILIIDDDALVCETFVKMFSRLGYDVSYSQTLEHGMFQISTGQFDVVFLDVNLPDGNGLEAIEIIREQPFAPEIIIMTGAGDSDGAELAMRSKAWDYIEKSRSFNGLKFSLHRALEYRLQKQARMQRLSIDRGGIVGESQALQKCLEDVSNAADNDLPVLITGETGTGKELFSRAIHHNSHRSKAEFVVVDCAALPEHLVESTLFGHKKGAFTGADSDKTGLMEMADNGTLFLDEVGELPLSVQKKFLRALQEKKFRPVGGKKEISSNFRTICATHRDLKKMVAKKQFREDLYFRILSMNIHLPPLKDRGNDIKVLALNHLSEKKGFSNENPCSMSDEFLAEIQMYDWPGNVRELINTLDRVCIDAGEGTTLFPHQLPGHIRAYTFRNKFSNQDKDSTTKNRMEKTTYENGASGVTEQTFKAHIESAKHEYLNQLLSRHNGNIKAACKISGLSKSQLYRLMQQYDLKTAP